MRGGLRALLFTAVLFAMAAGRADAYVYWTDGFHGGLGTGGTSIGRSEPDGTAVDLDFITGLGCCVQGVTVDSAHIYWTTWANAGGPTTIGRANLDGTGVNQSFIAVDGRARAVAVDAGHVYWTNFDMNSIGRANLNGTGVNQNFITGAGDGLGTAAPAGLAVNSTHVFWGISGFQRGTIARANLDGTGMNRDFITGASGPDGVAVDSGHVYWANQDAGTIGRANLNGTGATQSFVTGLSSPLTGVAVDPNHVYWGSVVDDIERANLDGTGANAFVTGTFHPLAVAVDAGSSAAPTVTTNPASSVSSTGAALNATINPGGAKTTYKYEYGTTTAFGTLVPASGTLDGGRGNIAVSQTPQSISGLSPGTTYYYRACANNAISGAGAANQVCGAVRALTTSGTSAPWASTAAASAITNSSAQVAGTITAHGLATAYVFEYGTSTAFGQIAPLPAGSAGSGTAELAVSTTLSGLQPNTTYFYRLVATNAAGTTNGPVRLFTSGPPTAPAVTTAAASNVTQGFATLSGTVNAKGQPTAFTFEYGTTTAFGHIATVDNAGDFNGSQQFSSRLSGLTAGTTYLYRIVATNPTGTSRGAVMSFTTEALKPIYWAQGATIARAGSDGSNVDLGFIPSRDGRASSIAVDATHVYWGNEWSPGDCPPCTGTNGSIGRANLDGTGVNQSFITIGGLFASVRGVAVHAGHIYWTNSDMRAIGRAKLDGSEVDEDFIVPGGLIEQLTVHNDHIYWTSISPQAVGRANLDGTGVDAEFITVGGSARGVAVDAGHVYWTNSDTHTIGRAKLDGTGVEQSFVSALGDSQPSGVAVDAGHVYWTTRFPAAVGRANLDGTGVDHHLIDTYDALGGIVVAPAPD